MFHLHHLLFLSVCSLQFGFRVRPEFQSRCDGMVAVPVNLPILAVWPILSCPDRVQSGGLSGAMTASTTSRGSGRSAFCIQLQGAPSPGLASRLSRCCIEKAVHHLWPRVCSWLQSRVSFQSRCGISGVLVAVPVKLPYLWQFSLPTQTVFQSGGMSGAMTASTSRGVGPQTFC